MIEAPLTLAFVAGLVATLNPCGIAMLPAYLSFFLGLDDDGEDSGAAAVSRALAVGGMVTLGFVVVFGSAGLALTLGLRFVVDVLPWAAIVVGVAIAGLGIAMLAGYRPATDLPGLERKGGRSYSGVFVFGLSYAVASLSCTLPVFLAVVAGGITGANFLSAVLTVLAYAGGMALMLVALTLVVAFGRQTVVQRLTRASRYVNRVAGAILLLAGGYIVYFWASNLGTDPGTLSDPTRVIESISSSLTELVSQRPLISALTAGALILAAAAYAVASRQDQDRSRS